MFRRRLWLAAIFCLAGTRGNAATAVDWILPPLDGELAGEFSPLKIPGAPPLRWKIAIRTAEPLQRTVDFTIEGSGTRVRGAAVLDPLGEGTWRILESEIDLAQWLPGLLPLLHPELTNLSIAGMLTATGEGTWRGGKLGGRTTVALRNGRVDDPNHKILLEGLTLDLELEDIAARRAPIGQILTWRNGRYDVVNLGTGRIEFALNGDELRVNEAAFDVFGGELHVGSLVMSLSRPEFSVSADMSRVAVDQILFLLPPVLAEARGRLDGRLELKRDAAGVQIGRGRLSLREGETADLRLMPTPGLISASLPAKVLEYYPGLGKMETGGIPLRADALEITFTPEGDAEGRTASVHIAGGPTDPTLKAPIDLKVNIRGPLQALIQFGTNSRLRF